MDLNSHIDWQPGMPLKAQTFHALSRSMDEKGRFLLSLFSQGRLLGILPHTRLDIDGMFVRNEFEMASFRLTALLGNGMLIDADEPVKVNIPMLYGSEYYLTVSLSGEEVGFESDDVPFTRPRYEYSLRTLEEARQSACMPVAKFTAKQGLFQLDETYIPPYLFWGDSPELTAFVKETAEKLDRLAGHANMEEGDAHRTLLKMLFELRAVNGETLTDTLFNKLQEIAQGVEYFIMKPNGASVEIQPVEILDVRMFMNWMTQFMDNALLVLDGVELVDRSIDYEKLKAEIKAEIYERLNPELYERLIKDVEENLRTSLTENLTATFRDYFDHTLRPQLHDVLKGELPEEMEPKLYDTLYKALYDALYVPKEEDVEFVPII